jgi:PKD repeat protein
VAEAISHEVGHNVGLSHDGYSGGSYYGGQGTGATGWAPIMGVGYSKPLVQWSKGEYATATNTQDDYVVMAGNGLLPRTDDHADTLGGATPMAGTVNGAVVSLRRDGIIEHPGDIDVFSFSAGAGSATFTAVPANRSPNVDLRLELRDAGGALLATSNPPDALAASIAFTLPSAGTYYLTVTGVGMGDPLTTGYTDYGSVGQYAVSAEVPNSGAGVPPQAAIAATPTSGTAPLVVNFSGAGSSDADGNIVSYEWTFGDGSSGVGANVVHTYASTGSYTAQLRVTDNTGLSAMQSLLIDVKPVVVLLPMHVSDIAMSLEVKGKGTRAVAVVGVRDERGQPVVGATVTGQWSGAVGGTASLVTDGSGNASFRSSNIRGSGSFTFAVKGVQLNGYEYHPEFNVETSDTITR